MRRLWFRLFVLWFCAAQVLFLVLGARLFFDLRAAASALRQQEALLEAGSRAAPQGVAELEKGPRPAYVRLPSLQVFSVPTAVSLQVEFWSRRGLEAP